MGPGPLHIIFLHDQYFKNKIQFFVDAGLDVQAKDYTGNSILHKAVKRYKGIEQQVQDIRQLVKLGIPLSAQNDLGLTPLHIHIEEECHRFNRHERVRVSLLSLLLEIAASPEGILPEFLHKQDKDGLTPLHIASIHSEEHFVRLLDAGANASILTKDGRSALHLAARARKSNIVGLLLQRTGPSLLRLADVYGRTALHHACASGRLESVYYLLHAGADVNARDNISRSPLHACAEFPMEQCQWLHPKVAGQHHHNRYRPLNSIMYTSQPWYASRYSALPKYSVHFTAGARNIVTCLIKRGADRTTLDQCQSSPLDLAIANSCQEMVDVL